MHCVDTDKAGEIKLSKEPCMWWKTKKYLDISPDIFDDPKRNEMYVQRDLFCKATLNCLI